VYGPGRPLLEKFRRRQNVPTYLQLIGRQLLANAVIAASRVSA
jgi:hypothetical protein